MCISVRGLSLSSFNVFCGLCCICDWITALAANGFPPKAGEEALGYRCLRSAIGVYEDVHDTKSFIYELQFMIPVDIETHNLCQAKLASNSTVYAEVRLKITLRYLSGGSIWDIHSNFFVSVVVQVRPLFVYCRLHFLPEFFGVFANGQSKCFPISVVFFH